MGKVTLLSEQPENENVRIWRYMDFTKLVSLVDSRTLYFSRADKLGDPFEGSYPRINVDAREQAIDEVPPEVRDDFRKFIVASGDFNKQWRRHIAVNCWHMNEHESAAMWKLYLKSDEGIAVQSTYRRLRESIIDDQQAFLGMVRYIDYEKDAIDRGLIQSTFFYKRKSFEHEREVRALVIKFPRSPEKGLDFSQEAISDGLMIKVDVEHLIERVYVAPSTPNWLADLTRSVIQRYGCNFEVMPSRLDDRPVF